MPEEKSKEAESTIPASLRSVLAKLPNAEAIQIIDDLGRVSARGNNNNNNNNRKATLQEKLLDTLAVLEPTRLKEILGAEG